MVLFSIQKTSIAQTFEIPDANFKKYLQDSLPSVMNTEGQLLIAEANKYPLLLKINDKGIQDVSGLEHFTSTVSFLAYSNNLRNVKGLEKLKKLDAVILFSNQIDSLPTLPFFNLKLLNLIDNKLTYMPLLDSLEKLEDLNLARNNLKALPSFSSLKNLLYIECGENQLTSLPDFSNNKNLKKILCYKNQLTKLPILNNNTLLNYLHADYNYLDTLQDFSYLDSLQYVNVSGNQLTFEDLLPSTKHPRFSSVFVYSPQRNVGTKQTFDLNEFDNLELNLKIDINISTNSYKWFRNGQYLKTTNKCILVLEHVQLADSGTYTCEVTNSNPTLSALVLKCEPIHVKIKDCISFTKPTITVQNANCNEGGKIDIKFSQIMGGLAPYEYQIQGKNVHQKYSSTNGKFESITPDDYQLIVKDAGICFKELSESIILTHNLNKCNEIILTPNGDGKNDEFYFNEIGVFKIYNSKGLLIRKIDAPTTWDGTNEKGEAVPGYYIIKNEKDEAFYITVLN